MQLYNQEIDTKALPFDLEDCRKELGLLKNAVIKCPGVYLLHMCSISGSCLSHDLYVVMENAPISREARAYGKALSAHPDMLLYPVTEEDFSYKIIEFEVTKFYMEHDLPASAGESLHSLALYGSELCPEYFGAFPAPRVTPWGYMTRYKTIQPGVFWIETDQCTTALAISYIMEDDLSEEVSALARLTDFDKEHGIDETMGYLFFEEKNMCLVIFELLRSSPGLKWDKVDEPALMNAVWKGFPEYATSYNLSERRGSHDILGKVLKHFDPCQELKCSPKDMITLSPDAGLDFFRF